MKSMFSFLFAASTLLSSVSRLPAHLPLDAARIVDAELTAPMPGLVHQFVLYATNGSGVNVNLPRGYYRLYVSGSWSYSPGRWHSALGDPYKTNTGGNILPSAYFSQLVFNTSAGWDKFRGNGMWVYSPGGTFRFVHNDRPGQHNDNAGSVRVEIHN